MDLWSRVWYPVKVIHIRHNLYVGTETLYLIVYEPIAVCACGGPSPNFGEKGGVKGSSVVPREAHHNGHNLSIETDTLSHFV